MDKIEELEKKINDLTALLDQDCVKGSYEVKRCIENEIDYLERDLRNKQCKLTYEGLVGKYFIYNDSRDVEYIFVRCVKGEEIVCDRILHPKEPNTFRGELVVDINQEFSYFQIGNFKEIPKDEFFRLYREACDGAIQRGLGVLQKK